MPPLLKPGPKPSRVREAVGVDPKKRKHTFYMRDWRKEKGESEAEEEQKKAEEVQKETERKEKNNWYQARLREKVKSGKIEEEKEVLDNTHRKILDNLRWHLDEAKGNDGQTW
jgi:hypothetical protein